jgi:hypothetical protein
MRPPAQARNRNRSVRARWDKTLSRSGRLGGDALQYRTAGPDIVWSASQQRLLAIWAGLRAGQAVPAWRDLLADELAQRDTLMMLDAVDHDGALRFRIESLGGRIATSYGGDFTGRFLDEAIPPAWRDSALQTYQAAIVRRRPVYNVVDTLDRNGTLVRMERLLLPFTGARDEPEHVLASIETSSIAGVFEEHELGRSPYADGSCALVAVIEL